MRYVVKPPTKGGVLHVVVNADRGNDPIFVTQVPAEAYILAFALNAVAEGKTLTAHRTDRRGYIRYDGPTESVAP